MFQKLALIALSSALALPIAGLSAAPREINGIAATVNGRPITKSEVDEAAKHTRNMINLTIPPGAERNKQLAKIDSEALNSLIERELILAEFDKIGFVVKEALVDEDVNKIIAGERFNGDRDKFLGELKASGMTLKRFKDLRRKIIAVEMMRGRNGGGTQIVTPAQVEAAYAEHGDRFRGESFVRLRTLMLPKITAEEGVTAEDQRKLMDTIRRKVVTGTDTFEQMAKTYSQDSVAENGGDRGTIGAKSKDLRPDLVAAAVRLNSGQISEVLEDSHFFWLLKAENKKLGTKKPLTDPTVYKTCERLAQLELRKEANERWVNQLKRTASIRRFDGQSVSTVAPPKPKPVATIEPGSLPPEKEAPKPEKKPKLIARIIPTGDDADAAADAGSIEKPEKKKLINRLRPFKK
jgi:parvulin-like peptidyl-prolyl isomerase